MISRLEIQIYLNRFTLKLDRVYNEFLDFVLKQVQFVENPPSVQPDFLIHSLAHLLIFCLKAIAKCLLSPLSERTFWLKTASRFRLSFKTIYLFFVLCLVELPG